MCDKTFYILNFTNLQFPTIIILFSMILFMKKIAKKDFCLHHATDAYHKNPKLQHQTAKVLLDASFLSSPPPHLIFSFINLMLKQLQKSYFLGVYM